MVWKNIATGLNRKIAPASKPIPLLPDNKLTIFIRIIEVNAVQILLMMRMITIAKDVEKRYSTK